MTATQTLIHLAAVLALATALPAAHANTTAEGVKCPTGSTARLSNGDRKLVCEAEERVERASVCSPLVFKNNGDVNLNTRIEPQLSGSDSCVEMCIRDRAGTGVALSLLVLAVALLRVTLGGLPLLVLAVTGGMLHGYEYGESIAGAPALPALAYATGLLVVQALMLCAVHGGWSRVIERSPVWRPSARRGLALLIGLVGAWALGGAA